MTSTPDLSAQDAKFGYKAPESVYKKPEKKLIDQGKAFTGVSPMDFYMRQNAAKKAEKAKETQTKVGVYKNDLAKSYFG